MRIESARTAPAAPTINEGTARAGTPMDEPGDEFCIERGKGQSTAQA
ncbi:hypothetical protein [Micromonospora chersina]